MNIEPHSKFTVEIPVPPSTNHLFATVRGNRRVKSKAYREWLAAVFPVLMELRKPKALPAEVCATVYGKVNKGRDLDNLMKPIGDAIVTAGVLPGDSIKYVTRWSIGYGGAAQMEPCVLIEVRAAG